MPPSNISERARELRNIAAVAERAGDYARAGEALEQLSQLNMADARAELRCTLHFILARHFSNAAAAIARAEKLAPNAPHLWPIKIELAAAQRKWADMAAIARAWLAAAPQQAQAREALARALLESGDLDGAAEAFQPIIEASPNPPAAHALTYGRICLNAQRFEEAERYLDMALSQNPTAPDALVAKARLSTFHGDTGDAADLCERAIAQDPGHPRAYQQLAIIKRGRLEPRHKDAIESLWRNEALEPLMRSAMGFALADAAFREGDGQQALDLYHQANGARRALSLEQNVRYDRAAMERDIDLLIESAPALLEASESDGENGGPDFIFVVGFPRSGTTLVESILATHPTVTAGGERAAGPDILQRLIALLRSQGAQKAGAILEGQAPLFRQIYQDKLPDIAPTTILTDKMPGNALAAPLLSALFPRARFVACRRDPFDVAISIYRHQFPNAYAWSHQLDDIAHFMEHHERAMAAFIPLMSGRLTVIDYDQLVAEPKSGRENVIAAGGLEWDEACADHASGDRPIATFSSVQVREPISRSASDGGDLLRPLLTDFAAQLEAWLSPYR